MSTVPSVAHYWKVVAALLALLLLTVGAAYVNLGPLNSACALLISLSKALLILVFFMHLRTGAGLMRLAAAVGFFWLGIMITLTLSDYLTRG